MFDPIPSFRESYTAFKKIRESQQVDYIMNLDPDLVSVTDLKIAFDYAFKNSQMIKLDKIARRLNYTDEFIWELAISRLNFDVCQEYINRISVPSNGLINACAHDIDNLEKIIKLCLDHKINITFI